MYVKLDVGCLIPSVKEAEYSAFLLTFIIEDFKNDSYKVEKNEKLVISSFHLICHYQYRREDVRMPRRPDGSNVIGF